MRRPRAARRKRGASSSSPEAVRHNPVSGAAIAVVVTDALADADCEHELRRHWCGLLHPDTGVRQLYDLLQMSILLWFLFILPYRLGFVVEPKGWEIAFDIVIDCILGVDILLNFHM